MPTCHHCGTTIVFGGVRHGAWRYCNQKCHDSDLLRSVLDEIPPGFAEEKAQRIFEGPCSKCGGRGPVDVHTAHAVWAFAIVTHATETPNIACQSCGTRARLKAILTCSLFGWWSLEGMLTTPVQIVRNLYGLMTTTDSSRPSPTLVELVREQLAQQLIEEDGADGDA